jgi:hypothetical protein
MQLDIALMKLMTGGQDVEMEGRRCGSSEQFDFVWQAGIVLVFNEGDCPKFDASDAPFTARMVVVPMRAKFMEGAADIDEPYTFEADPRINRKMKEWLPALADVLLEYFVPELKLDRLPASMTEWKRGITVADNPYAKWLEEHVVVTGDKDDIVLMTDITERAGECKDALTMVKAFFSGIKGVTFVAKTTVTVVGRQTYPRNCFRGVRMTPGAGGDAM